MKVYLDMVGCRLNQAEIEQYARQCRLAGHALVPSAGDADLVIINTCSVTAAAASDSRQKIRQAARAGGEHIVVTGCWSSMHPQEAASLESVSRVVSNSQKEGLITELLQFSAGKVPPGPIERVPIPGARTRTRAFIKVQDGCDNHCTFCVATIARGPGRSRRLHEILADVRYACDGGDGNQAAKEIVLTGVRLGSWGRDLTPAQNLRHLIQAILEESPAPRLRLSSLEPWDLDEGFFDLWEDPRLCRHLHMPLQSGSAACLQLMARKTSPGEYAQLVASARASIPGVAITTDLIAGFPGETDDEFQESLDFVRSMRFAGGHVFTFSSRPGTAAARMPDHVPHPVRKKRNARLRAVLSESSAAYQELFVDQVLPVLWEKAVSNGANSWELSGHTDNYLRVSALAPRPIWNRITPVRLVEAEQGGMRGQINTR